MSVTYLKHFETVAYIGILGHKQSKLDTKTCMASSQVTLLMGYRIWFPDMDNIIETINVPFNENIPNDFWHRGASHDQMSMYFFLLAIVN